MLGADGKPLAHSPLWLTGEDRYDDVTNREITGIDQSRR